MKACQAGNQEYNQIAHAVRAAYDQIASDYATVNADMPPDLIEAAARFARLLGPSQLVLDAGCGAGRDMVWLLGLGLAVVGADCSAGMLSEARRQGRLALMQMDMRSLGLRPDSFHGLWCCAALLHLAKQEVPAALLEMRRVLRPAGTLFLSVAEGATEAWDSCPYAKVKRYVARYGEEEIASFLAQAGFSVLSICRIKSVTGKWLQIFARRE